MNFGCPKEPHDIIFVAHKSDGRAGILLLGEGVAKQKHCQLLTVGPQKHLSLFLANVLECMPMKQFNLRYNPSISHKNNNSEVLSFN